MSSVASAQHLYPVTGKNCSSSGSDAAATRPASKLRIANVRIFCDLNEKRVKDDIGGRMGQYKAVVAHFNRLGFTYGECHDLYSQNLLFIAYVSVFFFYLYKSPPV